MKPSLRVLPLLVLLCGEAACAPLAPGGGARNAVRHEYAEVHMGMPVRIVLHAADDSSARTAARAAFRRIAQLEDVFSDYRTDSELRRLERSAGGWVTVSAPLFDVLLRAVHIARITGGAFDPTVAPLSRLWREARRTGAPPDPAAAAAARRLVGWHRIALDPVRSAVRLEPGTALDLGGMAKGWILQDALATLALHGAPAALLEAGGDVVAGAAPPGREGWTIDVPGADPSFRRRAAALTGAALATSGPAFQYLDLDGVRHSHVLDPRSGLPITRALTAHVIAIDGALADALATALGVLGPAGIARIEAAWPGVAVSLTDGSESARRPAPGRR